MRIAHAPIRLPATSVPAAPRRWASGIASLDAALAGGFALGRVHEIFAAETGDTAAAAGFAAALATVMIAATGDEAGEVLWLRRRSDATRAGVLQASGWAELGGRPERCLIGLVPDATALLRAAADALRSGAPGAVVVEGWGRMAELDLTASRRLALAAEKSDVPLLLVRIDAEPAPSAAQTRWQVSAAPSRALPGKAPGAPVFAIELLRQRSGPAGLNWRLEWDRDRCMFREAALSGAVVPVPAGGAAADARTGALRPIVARNAA